jgi:hypothetical protein
MILGMILGRKSAEQYAERGFGGEDRRMCTSEDDIGIFGSRISFIFCVFNSMVGKRFFVLAFCHGA